jgi:hypothetical protein
MKEPKESDPGSPMETRSSSSSKDRVTLGPEIRDRIARDLRMMWDEVVREGIPSQFVDFLERLENQTAKTPDSAQKNAHPDGMVKKNKESPSGKKEDKESQ